MSALYGSGIPAMVLLSKADLIRPRGPARMSSYIQEQIRRELGLDLAVRMVSTVGADESLLMDWYEKELTPLFDHHRSLTESSVKHKIACLLESVIATLELLLAKGRGDGPDGRVGAGRLKHKRSWMRPMTRSGDVVSVHRIGQRKGGHSPRWFRASLPRPSFRQGTERVTAYFTR